jgi:hypothetical protein
MRHALNVLFATHAMRAYIIAPTVKVALNMRSRLGRCTAIRPAIGALMYIDNRPGYLGPMANDCCGGDPIWQCLQIVCIGPFAWSADEICACLARGQYLTSDRSHRLMVQANVVASSVTVPKMEA